MSIQIVYPLFNRIVLLMLSLKSYVYILDTILY